MQSQTTADGGESADRDLPREYGYAGQEAGTVLDALDDLRAGDRVLWGDREVPCVVARVVDADDRIGQSLTAAVMSSSLPRRQKKAAAQEWDDREYPDDFFLKPGDVFLNPNSWGTLRGKRFAVIQGPRGGFYALAEPEANRTYPALFRAVRSYHRTKLGHKGRGAWNYERDMKEPFTIVESGDEPDELDPGGDLPTWDEIRDNRLVSYDRDAGEHYAVAETVAEAFDEGLLGAHSRAKAEFKAGLEGGEEADDDPWADVPSAERVTTKPEQTAAGVGTVTVTGFFRSEYGMKATLDTPAPWEVPDHATPANDVLKDTPWDENHRQWDPDREAWTVDASELVKVARTLAAADYYVADEAEREGDD